MSSRVSRAVLAHLQTLLPARLAFLRATDPFCLVGNPKTWWAHERFPGAAGVNSTNTPVVMVTVDGDLNTRSLQSNATGGYDWVHDTITRVVVCVHGPKGGHQETYDACEDLMSAVMDVLIERQQITMDLVVAPKTMQAVRTTPTNTETSRTYAEGMVTFVVSGSRTLVGTPVGTVATIDVTVRPDVDEDLST